MMNKRTGAIFTKSNMADFGLMNLGVFLTTVGIYFFKFPNSFSMGGVSGIAVILGKVVPNITPGAFVFILNISLLLLGFVVFGKGFGGRTAYASLAFSVETWIFEKIFPMSAPFTNQPLLELIFAVMLPAAGSAILFNIGSSSGGTDVIAMILKKYTHCNIGRALLYSDIVIVLCSFAVFGMQIGLFSLLGLGAKALIVDNVIESINLCKYFNIITTKPDEVCDFIVNELNRGATKLEAHGAFANEEKMVVLTVVGRAQGIELQHAIKKIDNQAFVLITNTSEIIGKGFRGVN